MASPPKVSSLGAYRTRAAPKMQKGAAGKQKATAEPADKQPGKRGRGGGGGGGRPAGARGLGRGRSEVAVVVAAAVVVTVVVAAVAAATTMVKLMMKTRSTRSTMQRRVVSSHALGAKREGASASTRVSTWVCGVLCRHLAIESVLAFDSAFPRRLSRLAITQDHSALHMLMTQ